MWGNTIDLNGDGLTNGLETVIGDLFIFAAVVAAIVALTKTFMKLKKTSGRIDAFFEDWYGEQPREGIQARPGVLLRLHNLEEQRKESTDTLNDIQATVNQIQTQVEHELNRNGGGSTKDAAHEALRVATEIKEIQEQAVEEQALFRREFLEHQRVTNAEWEAVFATVKEMIGKPVDEQMALWTRVADAHIASEDDGA